VPEDVEMREKAPREIERSGIERLQGGTWVARLRVLGEKQHSVRFPNHR